MGFLKRLFVKFPLYTMFFIVVLTEITPILYWIVTGKDYGDLLDYIDNI